MLYYSQLSKESNISGWKPFVHAVVALRGPLLSGDFGSHDPTGAAEPERIYPKPAPVQSSQAVKSATLRLTTVLTAFLIGFWPFLFGFRWFLVVFFGFSFGNATGCLNEAGPMRGGLGFGLWRYWAPPRCPIMTKDAMGYTEKHEEHKTATKSKNEKT